MTNVILSVYINHIENIGHIVFLKNTCFCLMYSIFLCCEKNKALPGIRKSSLFHVDSNLKYAMLCCQLLPKLLL